MANIGESNGRRWIQFYGRDGKRRTVRLGDMTQRQARDILVRVEDLARASIGNSSPSPATAAWLADVGDTLHAKLVAVGLVEARAAALLGPFLDDLIGKRGDVKPATRITYENVKRNLLAHFGKNKPLRDITPGCADEFRLYLLNAEELADNTVRRRCGIARQFFKAAVRKRLIQANPFEGLAAAVKANRSRMAMIDRPTIQKVIDACPDAQWRLIVALSRYAGLRCPSEHLGLRWVDIDWLEKRMLVRSPKTEHHAGGESRLVPIFPELMPYLEAAYELVPEGGDEHVITRYRDTNANLRTQMLRIMRKAQVTPWPKLFHNLRATRQTELENEFPTHVVCAWLGNSPDVAKKHYLQVTDDHFAKAAATPATPAAEPASASIGPAGAASEPMRASTGASAGGASERMPRSKPAILAQKNADERTEAQVCVGGWAIQDSNL